jgi:SprT protein
MTQKERLQTVLYDYVPPSSAAYIADLIVQHKIAFRIAKNRKTKLGDYRPPFGDKGHRISINHNLNPYQFLITTIHELAHLTTWEQYRNKVKSHGREWQYHYSVLLKPLLHEDVFPEALLAAVGKSLNKPAASSCSDPSLSLALQNYDDEDGLHFVRDIPNGTTFILQGRFFEKGELIRKRFKCRNLENNKIYLVNGLSRAQLLSDN